MIQALAIMLSYYIDLIIGDPPKWPHPVKWFGRYIAFCERHFNKGRFKKLAGTMSLIMLLLLVFSSTVFLLLYLYRVHFLLGLVVEAGLIATTIAQKGLDTAAKDVYKPLKEKKLKEARKKLSYIVGRDTENLSEEEIVRSTVETVAENTTDGITAPLFWAFIGGAPLALVYRAINTCDSMVGYKTKELQRFGWASARLDDIVNWIPARLTGVLMLFMKIPYGRSFMSATQILLRDARKHNSPNSGWNEAAVAAVLGIQLGGINTYKGIQSEAPLLGDKRVKLEANHIIDTILIMKRVTLTFVIGGVLIVLTIARL